MGFDDPGGTPIAIREQTAELVDNFVGVQAYGLGVVSNERAREDARRPFREVVSFQSEPEIRSYFRDGDYGLDADPAPFTFTAQAGPEGLSVRHENLSTEQRSSRTISEKITKIRSMHHDFALQFCNVRSASMTVFVDAIPV